MISLFLTSPALAVNTMSGKPGEGAMGTVAQTREPLIIPSYHEWAGRSPKYANVKAHSVMVAPLLIGKRLEERRGLLSAEERRSLAQALALEPEVAAEIRSLAVNPGIRGRGIGAAQPVDAPLMVSATTAY